MKCLGTEGMCLLLSRWSSTSHEAHNWLELIPGSLAWSTYICIIAANPSPPPSGQDDSPPLGDLQHYVAVTHLYTWVKRDGEAKRPYYSNDTGMNFIPEQVHFISTYFSVFVYMILKWHFVPVQVTPELVPKFKVLLYYPVTMPPQTPQWGHRTPCRQINFPVPNCTSGLNWAKG